MRLREELNSLYVGPFSWSYFKLTNLYSQHNLYLLRLKTEN